MRNGMSVREIYEALDQRDRLIEQLQKERNRYADLESRIHAACWRVACVERQYFDIAYRQKTNASDEDRFEFMYRAKGLHEAVDIMRRNLADET